MYASAACLGLNRLAGAKSDRACDDTWRCFADLASSRTDATPHTYHCAPFSPSFLPSHTLSPAASSAAHRCAFSSDNPQHSHRHPARFGLSRGNRSGQPEDKSHRGLFALSARLTTSPRSFLCALSSFLRAEREVKVRHEPDRAFAFASTSDTLGTVVCARDNVYHQFPRPATRETAN